MTFPTRITRPVTALALAAALALSPAGSRTASAGNGDIYIAGAIGTVLLGALATAALTNPNRTTYSRVTPSRPEPVYNRTHTHRPSATPRHDHRDTRTHRPQPTRPAWQPQRRPIPASCIITVGRGHHAKTYLSTAPRCRGVTHNAGNRR